MGGVEIYLHAFFTSALDGNEQSASCSDFFITRDTALDTHQIEGWVGPSG